MLAQSPQRDRDIEAFRIISAPAPPRIRTLKYNMSLLGVGGWKKCRAVVTPCTTAGTNKDAAAKNRL